MAIAARDDFRDLGAPAPIDQTLGGYVVAGLLSENTVAAAISNTSAIQSALSVGGNVQIQIPGVYYTNDPLFIGPNSNFVLSPGVTIKSNATFGHFLLRNGNADFVGDSLKMEGVAIITASDGTNDGIGILRLYTAPNRLSWTAPGDSEGTPVNVTGTDGRYQIPSANGKNLHVTVFRANLPGATTATVRVLPMQGAKSVSWSRTSNITTVTEPGHSRLSGDCAILCGSNFIGQAYVVSVTTNTWTFADSRADLTGSGEVYGIANVQVTGGTWNYNYSGMSTYRNTSQVHALMSLGMNRFKYETSIYDLRKYGHYVQGAANWESNVYTYSDSALSSSSAISVQGKSYGGRIRARGHSTDNLIALLCGDFGPQTFLWVTDEGGLHIDDTTVDELTGDNCKFQLCRLVGALNQWISNTRIRNVGGSVDSNTTSILSCQVDALLVNGTQTNIDGLLIDGVAVSKSGTTSCQIILLACSGIVPSRGIVLENIRPQFPAEINGGAAIAIQTGLYEDITIRNSSNGQPNWQGCFVTTNGSAGTVERLVIDNINLTIDNALRTNTWRSYVYNGVGNGIIVREVNILNSSVRDNSSAGNKAYLVGCNNSAGSHGAVNVYNCRVKNCQGVSNNAFSDAGVKYKFVGINMDGTSFCLNFDGIAAEVHVGSVFTTGAINSVVLINFSTSVMKIRSLGGMPSLPTNKHVYIAGGTANSPDVEGSDMVVDITKLAAINGNMVIDSATSIVNMCKSGVWTPIA